MNNLLKNSSLKKILSSKQLKLLDSYSKAYNLHEIVNKNKLKRNSVFLEFIYLGKALAVFDWLYCRLLPPEKKAQEFIDGFNYCKYLLKKKVLNAKETRKKKLSRKKRFKK